MIHYKKLEIRNDTSICNYVNLQGSLQCHIEKAVNQLTTKINKCLKSLNILSNL